MILVTLTNLRDVAGVAASSLCAVHCLATPFVLAALPAWGEAFAHPAAHWVLALVVVPLAIWAVLQGFRRHRRIAVPIVLIVGLGLVVAATLQPAYASATETKTIETDGPSVGTTDANPTAACAACCPLARATAGAVAIEDEPVEAGGAWPFYAMVAGGGLLLFGHGLNLVGCRRACCSTRGNAS